MDLPPLGVPVLIRRESGRVLAGIVGNISVDNKLLRLDRVSILETIGLKEGLEPIYQKVPKKIKYAFINTEEIVHWEKLPEYLELDPD